MEDRKKGKSIIDLLGQVFGRLTVIKFVMQDKWRSANWLCKCSCGNTCTISAHSLRSGNTKSCGCLVKDVQRERSTTHGMFLHPAYKIWASDKSRTTNPNDARWEDYGGRGIKMCLEWEESFEAFWLDMGPTWKEGLTLDRVDVNGNYCKENCRWTTNSVQAHNRRKKKNCSSKYVGVRFHKKAGKFLASIKNNGKSEYLGLFLDEKSAALAYDNRSEELYGDRPNNT